MWQHTSIPANRSKCSKPAVRNRETFKLIIFIFIYTVKYNCKHNPALSLLTGCATLLSRLSHFIEFSKCKCCSQQAQPLRSTAAVCVMRVCVSVCTLTLRTALNWVLVRLICLAKCCNNSFER